MQNGMWQPQADKLMREFISSYADVKKITTKGSLQDEMSVDTFSDVDLEIKLADVIPFTISDFVEKLPTQFGVILGYEIHHNERDDVLRVCFENSWRFDLTFQYPTLPMPRRSAVPTVDRFWFIASLALVRLGREDYLMASHLALELCQLVLVMQMVLRDKEKNTNIHRFGDKEVVPVLMGLGLSGGNTRAAIANLIFHAARHMDNVAMMESGYTSRRGKLQELAKFMRL
ncbi:MAG: hypothetical protein FWC16_06545 [Defluviitaleaceae bacterium]|nr:hypothetical protein [Defluviitaleaceae bacterium]MCL2274569.1 hypothetical protein [Defluviitaleaceae bacterium]